MLRKVAKVFKKLILRLFLYLKGIRFYQTETILKSDEFKRAEFRSVDGKTVHFYFYKEECEDLIFKLGRIRKETFVGYVIQAKLDDSLPDVLYKYNNLKFFFNSKNMLIKDDDAIADTLLRIYIDFIKHELSLAMDDKIED